MKNVRYVFEMPRDSDYVGGIAVILNQYLKSREVFANNDCLIDIIDLSDKKRSGNKLVTIINVFIETLYAKNKVRELDSKDVIHMHTSREWTLLKDMYIAKSMRKVFGGKMVLSIHFADVDKILYSNPILRRYQITTMKKTFDSIIFLSEHTRNEFISNGLRKEQTEILYTFHNFSYSNVSFYPKDIIELLFVGSIDKRKGICDLLESLERINSENVMLHVCGQFTDEAVKKEFYEYQQKLGSRLVFHGYVSGEEKKEIFRNSDILVLPSYGEGMPIVIMEAMASGCAIVSTKVGAIPEVIKERNGILHEPGDISALSTALIKLIENKELLSEIKQTNYRESSVYSLNTNIHELCKIYLR